MDEGQTLFIKVSSTLTLSFMTLTALLFMTLTLLVKAKSVRIMNKRAVRVINESVSVDDTHPQKKSGGGVGRGEGERVFFVFCEMEFRLLT
jgi:hypothetical protein